MAFSVSAFAISDKNKRPCRYPGLMNSMWSIEFRGYRLFSTEQVS